MTPGPPIAVLRRAVDTALDPETGASLGELGMVRGVTVHDSRVGVTVAAASGQLRAADQLSSAIAEAVARVEGVQWVEVGFVTMTPGEERAVCQVLQDRQTSPSPGFADGSTMVVLVASGKGGVGKSTVAVNLACAYAAAGLDVGLLDADVWGYSVPSMLGTVGDPVGIGDLLLPERAFGVKAVSVGFLVQPDSPVVWRGPMLHEAMAQFLSGVYWGDLDVLVADLPPGTGDVPMSLAALLPTASVVIVTTPQEAASRVAGLAGMMASKASLRVAGVIENMAGFVCPHCGERSDIFAGSGGQVVAEQLGVPLLGSIPLAVAVREGGDRGRPLVVDDPSHPASEAIVAVADVLRQQVRAATRHLIPVTAEMPGG